MFDKFKVITGFSENEVEEKLTKWYNEDKPTAYEMYTAANQNKLFVIIIYHCN